MGMIEAIEVVAPQGAPGAGPMEKILAFYALKTDAGEVEATKLTLELIAEVKRMVWDGPSAEEWVKAHHPGWEVHPKCRGPRADAERIWKWWLHYVGKEIEGEDKEEFEARWAEALKAPKAGFAGKLAAAIAKQGGPPQGEPEEVKAWLAAKEETARDAFAGQAKAKAEPAAEPAPKPEAKKIPAVPAWPEAPLPPFGATDLERLTYPRGLLGHAVQYIYDTARYPDRWLALAGALCALGKGIDRKVLGPSDNSIILYLLILAESGAGKQHILNCIRMLLRAMGEEAAYAAGGIASVQSIEQTVEALPSALVVIDEYGSFLTRISSKGQTGNVSEIPSTLQTLWGWPPQLEWQGSMKVGKEVVPVYGPAFAIFGSGTERAFFLALKRKEVASGFVNRHLLFNVGRGGKRADRKYHWRNCPGWLAAALKEVAPTLNLIDTRERKIGDYLVRVHDHRQIGWGPGAEDFFEGFEDEIRDMPSLEDRDLAIRAPEIALRLATIVAAYRGSGVVEIEDLKWSIALGRQSTTQLQRGVKKHMLDEMEQADLADFIRDLFRRAGRVTHGEIRKACERKTKDLRQIDLVIQHLVTTNEIAAYEYDGPGKPTHRWKWNG
jgi:hypothetical protein